jgi:hypothetical protein
MKIRERRTGNILENLDLFRVMSYIFALAVTLVSIVVLIRVILAAKEKNETPGKITEKILRLGYKIKKNVKDLLVAAYLEFFIDRAPNQNFLNYWRHFWYECYPYYRLISFLCITLPPFIVACALFIDVIILHTFHWLPRLAIILVIPLGLKTINWCTKYNCLEFCRLMETALEDLDVSDKGPVFRVDFIHTYPIVFQEIHENLDYSIVKYHNYKHFLRIYNYFHNVGSYEKLIFPILTGLLNITSWGYIVISFGLT